MSMTMRMVKPVTSNHVRAATAVNISVFSSKHYRFLPLIPREVHVLPFISRNKIIVSYKVNNAVEGNTIIVFVKRPQRC